MRLFLAASLCDSYVMEYPGGTALGQRVTALSAPDLMALPNKGLPVTHPVPGKLKAVPALVANL